MEICRECIFWSKHGKLRNVDSWDCFLNFGNCKNKKSEYYDSSISEEDTCSEFEEE